MISPKESQARSALIERFAEMVTVAARKASQRSDLEYQAPNAEGFTYFYCPLPGHSFKGAPSAWVHLTPSGKLQARCPKCVPAVHADDAAYFTALAEAIGWQEDNVVEMELATCRHHFYETFDGKMEIRRTKVTYHDRRKGFRWNHFYLDKSEPELFRQFRYFKPDEFCKARYPELSKFYFTLKLYEHSRIAASPSATVLICEGERDADTANSLVALIGCDIAATTLPQQTPTALTTHHREQLSGRDVVIISDTGNGGKSHTKAWGSLLNGVASRIRVLPPEQFDFSPTSDNEDLTDWVEREENAGYTRTAIARRFVEMLDALPELDEAFEDIGAWRQALIRTKDDKGVKSDSVANAEIALSGHPELVGRVRRNIRFGEPEIVDAPWGSASPGVRPLANALSAWLERTEKIYLAPKVLEAALNFDNVAPAHNPFEMLAGISGDAAELDDLFVKHFPLAVSRPTAVKAARMFWADFMAKLRGELVTQQSLLAIATNTPLSVAPRLAGRYGLVHPGTINQGHLLGFARQGAVLVQIGLDAVYNQRTAPNNLANIFAPHVFNQATQRRCPTPMFIAVGAAPSDPRTAEKVDERIITIKLES